MSNNHNNLALVLSDAIQSNNFDNALAAIKSLRPVDLADVLEELEPSLGWRLLERLPAVIAAYHVGYGAGTWRGLLDVLLRRRAGERWSRLTR